MKRIALAVILLVACAAVRPVPAEASCWKTMSCGLVPDPDGTVQCWFWVGSINPNGWPAGWYRTLYGSQCVTSTGSGYEGCVTTGVFVEPSGPPPRDWILVGLSQSQNFGCCSTPCPPPGTNCQPDGGGEDPS